MIGLIKPINITGNTFASVLSRDIKVKSLRSGFCTAKTRGLMRFSSSELLPTSRETQARHESWTGQNDLIS